MLTKLNMVISYHFEANANNVVDLASLCNPFIYNAVLPGCQKFTKNLICKTFACWPVDKDTGK